MNSYNKLPTELKDGSNQAASKVVESSTLKVLVKDQASTKEKILSYIGSLGSMRADAWGCNQYTGISAYHLVGNIHVGQQLLL